MLDLAFKIYESATSRGVLHFITTSEFYDSDRHVVVMLHGALRCCESLAGWVPVLLENYDVLLLDLPGHGRDIAEDTPTLSEYAGRIQEFLSLLEEDRRVVVIGESLGGLIALGLGQGTTNRVAGVIAADPPLSTAKQWVVHLNVMKPANPMTQYQAWLFAQTFGFKGDKVLKDHLYYPLIEKARLPTLILTGDTPLFPAMPDIKELPKHIPCVMDAVDIAFIEKIANPMVTVAVVQDAGHLCLTPEHSGARGLVVNFCDRHLGPRV